MKKVFAKIRIVLLIILLITPVVIYFAFFYKDFTGYYGFVNDKGHFIYFNIFGNGRIVTNISGVETASDYTIKDSPATRVLGPIFSRKKPDFVRKENRSDYYATIEYKDARNYTRSGMFYDKDGVTYLELDNGTLQHDITSREQYYYLLGVERLGESDYASAVDCFEKAGLYMDSQDKWKEASYMLANLYRTTRVEGTYWYDTAVAILYNDLKGYRDSDEILKNDENMQYYFNNELSYWRTNLKTYGTIEFGKYEQDNVLVNGPEAIRWKVLDSKDGKYLLLSDKCIEFREFNSTQGVKGNLWKDSTLRKWLNESFCQQAFSDSERNMILLSKDICTPSYSNISDGNNTGEYSYIENREENNTDDRIFLLAYDEVNRYLPGNEKRTYLTEYAKKKAISEYVSEEDKLAYEINSYLLEEITDGKLSDPYAVQYDIWLLRNDVEHMENLLFSDATLDNVLCMTNREGIWKDMDPAIKGGIRPAMWVSIPDDYIPESF